MSMDFNNLDIYRQMISFFIKICINWMDTKPGLTAQAIEIPSTTDAEIVVIEVGI